jgi:hypothetical protein
LDGAPLTCSYGLHQAAGAGLFVKRSKCTFSDREVTYLGHVISVAGVIIDRLKVQAVLDGPPPRSVHAVRAFLGLVGYYWGFIHDYGTIAAPLMKLLRKDDFQWGTEVEAAFRALQQALTSASVL